MYQVAATSCCRTGYPPRPGPPGHPRPSLRGAPGPPGGYRPHPVGSQFARRDRLAGPHLAAGHFRAPWGPIVSGLPIPLDRQVPPPVGEGTIPPGTPPPGGGPRPPREGVPSEGKLGVPGPPRRTPREGGPRPPGPGTPPGGPPGGPGPGGVHFRGYLITLPVGTDVAIRFRKGWFLGVKNPPPGARRAPSRGVRDPPGGGSRDPPPRGSKKGVFWPLRRPPKMGHF